MYHAKAGGYIGGLTGPALRQCVDSPLCFFTQHFCAAMIQALFSMLPSAPNHHPQLGPLHTHPLLK